MENQFFRFELKYIMESSLAREIESEIRRQGMKSSSHGEAVGGEYVVASLYFDTQDLGDYYDKQAGLLNRKKLRARIYESQLDSSRVIWLELKKKYDTKTHKKRLGLSPAEWQMFLEKGPSAILKAKEFLSPQEIKQEILWNFLAKPVKPTALVRYLRKPYRLGELRITFDRQLETCRADSLNYSGAMIPVEKKSVIMEVKFPGPYLPFWVKRIIQKYNLSRIAFSKYAYSIDAIYRFDSLPK